MTKSKLLVTYVLLVGLPLLGLLAILRAGERLTPPAAVAGPWNLEADVSSLADSACREILARVNQPFLTITQSGTMLTAALNTPRQATLPGTIQNGHLSLGPDRSGEPENISGTCLNAQAMRLKADVASDAGEQILVGTLSLIECPQCAPVPFRAKRRNKPESVGH